VAERLRRQISEREVAAGDRRILAHASHPEHSLRRPEKAAVVLVLVDEHVFYMRAAQPIEAAQQRVVLA
jgi:hypothetical protein